MWRMKAPAGVTGSTIEGHAYEVDSTGHVDARSLAHAQILRQHGYKPGEPDAAIAVVKAVDETPKAPVVAKPAAVTDDDEGPTRAVKMKYLEDRGLKQKGNVSNAVLDEAYAAAKALNDATDAAGAADNGDEAGSEEAE